MREVVEETMKDAAKEILLKVIRAHGLEERIAEALVNAIDANTWKTLLTGSCENIHVDFRLSFLGLQPEDLGKDKEITVTLYELVDGRPITRLFEQSLLKPLMRGGKLDYADRLELTSDGYEKMKELIEGGEVRMPDDDRVVGTVIGTPNEDTAEVLIGVDPAEPGKDETVVTTVEEKGPNDRHVTVAPDKKGDIKIKKVKVICTDKEEGD